MKKISFAWLHSKSKVISFSLFCVASIFSSNALSGQSSHHDYSNCGSTDSASGGSDSSSSYCESALGEYVYDLVDDGVNVGTDAANSSIVIDDVNVSVSVSAWSDTVGTYNDDVVTSATLVKISDYYGYGVYNADNESYGSNPDHAIDSVNTVSNNVDYDFDFILLSFSESVSLSSASFSWIGDVGDTQVSIAGLSDLSDLTSGTETWSGIVENALTAGSYDIENCDYVEYRADFEQSTSAQYWLIGAYNSVFGELDGSTMFDDAFKLTGIGFTQDGTPPGDLTEVSEPHTLGSLLAFLLFVAWRKRTVQIS